MVKFGIRSFRNGSCEGCWNMPGDLSIGAQLKAARKAAKIGAPEAGKATGVKANAVYNWENDHTEPSASQLLTLCRLYGIDLKDLNTESLGQAKSEGNQWEANVNLRLLLSDITREHSEAYPILVKDHFADRVLAVGAYALVEPSQSDIEPGTLCAVSVDGQYPIFARVTELSAGYRLSPDSHDPTRRDLIIDFEEGGDASVLGEVIWNFPPYAEAEK